MQRLTCAVAVLLLVACENTPTPEPENVCAEFVCDNGRCAVLDGAPACLCNTGFEARDGGCAEIITPGLCAAKPCEGLPNSVCLVEDGGNTRCVCPESRIEIGGECVLRSPCTPNPCNAQNQRTCDESTGVAICVCDDDYVPASVGCGPSAWWDCKTAHTTGDRAEPDECPRFAPTLQRDVHVERTLFPEGDNDWFRVEVTPGYVIAFNASGHVPLQLDVYTKEGRRIGGDGRGLTTARHSFLVPAATTELFVRIRARLSTDLDTYTAYIQDLGHDDYVNDAANALLINGGSFGGNVQYEGDLDVVRLTLPASKAMEFTNDGGGIAQFTLTFADGGTQRVDGTSTSFTAPTQQEVLITASARDERSEGVFLLEANMRGDDDHSDDPRFAKELPGNTVFTGRIQFSGDVDSFVFRPSLNHMYVPSLSGAAQSITVISADGTVVSVNGLAWKARSTAPVVVRVTGNVDAVPYQVRITELGLDDHGDTFGDASSINTTDTFQGRLEAPSDADVFSVDLPAGRVMEVSLTVLSGTANLRVTDRSGNQLANGAGPLRFYSWVADRYFVTVANATGLYPMSYSLKLRDVGADDFGPNPGLISVASSISGSLQYQGDVDAFTFQGVARHTYRAVCATVPAGACAITVSGNNVLAQSTGDGEVLFTPSTNGSLLVQLGLPTNTTAPVDWVLSIVDEGFDDHGGTPTTATPLTLGVGVPGRLGWMQDVDMFLLPVSDGGIYEFQLSGALNPYIEVTRSNGTHVVTLEPNSAFRARADETVRYSLTPRSSADQTNYVITAVDVGPDDHGDTFETATPLILPVNAPATATAKIQFVGDNDAFTFAASAPNFYTVITPCGFSLRAADAGIIRDAQFKPLPGVTQIDLRLRSGIRETCALSVQNDGPDDFGDTNAEATLLALDAGVSGSLHVRNDVDVFAIDVTTVSSDITHVEFTHNVTQRLTVELTTPSGDLVRSYDRTAFVADEVGRWFIAVKGAITPTYSVLATNIGPDDFDDSLATAISVNALQTGALQHPLDVDVFRVTLTAGSQYSIVGQASGTVLITNDADFLHEMVNGPFVAPATGSYEIRVSASASEWNPTQYEFRVVQ